MITDSRAVALLRFLPGLLLLGCGGGGSNDLRGNVVIDGSSTVYPIAEAVSEEFQLENPRVMVSVGRSGTGGGFERFCRGETDIATASRTMTAQEEQQCASGQVEYLGLPVALDGLSVIVNPGNTFLDCLTVQELGEIWRRGSSIRTWRDVRPEFPAEEIRLYGPGTDSGTYDTFIQAVVGEVGASRTDFLASEDDNVLVQGLTGDLYSLGYFGYAYLEENRDRLKVVGVDGGAGCIEPSPETIRDGSYSALGRQLFLYLRLRSLRRPGMVAFMEYFLSHAGELVPETGFLPLPVLAYEESLHQVRRLAGALRPGRGTAEDG
jgi:phosphate transport system substrate-binding protein